jgi:Fe-S-cluster containining protein
MVAPDPVTLAAAEQQALDTAIAAWLPQAGTRIHCGRGCASCCTLNVALTLAEALPLAESLDPAQRQGIAARVTALRELLPGCADRKAFLRAQRTLGPCPLLAADGACAVYPRRPLACRALHSTRDHAWCGVDFATLHPLEREAFLSSLDPAVVAFPTHYARVPRELAAAAEDRLLKAMHAAWGFALSGHLAVLLQLAGEPDFVASLTAGRQAVAVQLAARALDHPFLVTLHEV